MRVVLIGLGLIGRERLAAIRNLNQSLENRITVEGYLDPGPVAELVDLTETRRLSSLRDVVGIAPDIVFVSTPHDTAFEISKTLLQAGIRVHLDKPMGCTLSEARVLFEESQKLENLTLGFNYRYMAGVRHLLEDCEAGLFGPLISVSMALGHGGSPDDRQSWKLDPFRAGGGCLIDPGIHLLDLLCRMFEKPTPISCQIWRGFWNTGIEEEAQVALVAGSTLIRLDISVVRWRSTFCLEVHGVDGYGRVDGRGRSYGVQKYTRGRRWGWLSGIPQRDTEELICVDDCASSFAEEIEDLVQMPKPTSIFATAKEGLRTMELLEKIRDIAFAETDRPQSQLPSRIVDEDKGL